MDNDAQQRIPGGGMARLQAVMTRLRGPAGCPWDREQTLETLKPCLLEEVHELLEAMEEGTPGPHLEELGDVLLQVVFQSHIRAERGEFALDDVAHALCDKLVLRHPHVFGDVTVTDSADVLKNWEAIKKIEKSERVSVLDGVPRSLPALLRAQRTQAKASRVGFDWPDAAGPLAKIVEEAAELRQAVDAGAPVEALRHEAGDLLFSVVNLCRFLDVDAEQALQVCSDRFSRRFRRVEASAKADGVEMKNCPLDQLDRYWEAAKREESGDG
jgi:MazG family protein